MPKPIQVLPYDPSWPEHFNRIATQLRSYLTTASVPYTAIEHIGSTSIPHLASKPNIDIVVIVPTAAAAVSARDALIWVPEPTEYYKCIGNGGIRGRMSMKFQDWNAMPKRSVYIVSEQDEEGMMSVRGYRDVRECLRKEEHQGLRREYGECKMAMVREGCSDGVEYGRAKNEVIRKILKVCGWRDEEVDAKEALDVRGDGWERWEL